MASSLHLSQLRKWFLASPPIEWTLSHVRELLISAIQQGAVPEHVAFVMDGNRRFAKSHRIETVEGHNLGFEALARILEVCYKSGVRVVTIYAFSIENFKRSKYEVDALMDMAKVKLSQLAQHGDLLDRYGASVRVLGRRELVKPDVLEAIDRAVDLTSRNGDCVLNICFPYTSRDEIASAIRNTVIDYSTPLEPASQSRTRFSEAQIADRIRAQAICAKTSELNGLDAETLTSTKVETEGLEEPDVKPDHSPYDSSSSFASSTTTLHQVSTTTGELVNKKTARGDQPTFLSPETITPRTLTEHMFTADNPPLDLLIRTSGVERLSDFMLWQCHQNTQIVFLETLWPEFDLWQFLPVIWEWQWRMRKLKNSREDEVEMRNESSEEDLVKESARVGSKIKSR